MLLALFLNLSGFSQTMRFKNISVLDGLSQSEVFSILEDSKGFMWLGTMNGLNKYDGYTFTIYNTERGDPNSLINNTIRILEEDNHGRMWIGTDNGICLYDQKQELIHQMNIPGYENALLGIRSIIINEDTMWVGTSDGLFKANIGSENLLKIKLTFKKIRNIGGTLYDDDVDVKSLALCKDGGLWLASNSFVSKIKLKNGNDVATVLDTININTFKRIVLDKNGNLWGTLMNNGMYRYNATRKKIDIFSFDKNNPNSISSNLISAFAFDRDDNLWIGTKDNGINVLSADQLLSDTLSFTHIHSDPFNPNSLHSNLIYHLYFDHNGLLWIGTIGSGVDVYNPNQKAFNHYQIPPSSTNQRKPSNFIRSVHIDQANRIWLGTQNNGLFIFDRNKKKYSKIGFETDAVYYIYGDDSDKMIICSSSGVTLVSYKNSKLHILDYIHIGPSFHIVQTTKNSYFAATFNGLLHFQLEGENLIELKLYNSETIPALSHKNSRVLLYEKETNILWIGTEGGGLNLAYLDEDATPKIIHIYKKEEAFNTISSNYIRAIIKSSEKNIWIGTYEGLNKLIRNDITGAISFKSFTVKDGLPNNMVQLIEEDNLGNLWLGTNGGLVKFKQDTNKTNITVYKVSDGLQSNEFSEHTSFKRWDGEIAVGGIGGINTFYPEEIITNHLQFQPVLTSIYVGTEKISVGQEKRGNKILSKSLSITDSIALLPKQNDFRLEFSAMQFYDAKKIKYAYLLEGYDKDWNVSNERYANYTNIRHGKYLFKVKATNDDGLWAENTTTLFIHIKTPITLTWYAISLYVIVFVLFIYYLAHLAFIRKDTTRRILLVNEHNQKLQELNVLRTKFFINISHDLRTPLTLISGPLESIMRNSNIEVGIKEKLEIINRNVKRLRYLTEQLLDIRRAEAGKLVPKLQSINIVEFAQNESNHFEFAIESKQLELNIIAEKSDIYVDADPDMLSKIFFNLLSNALKYTNKGEINIKIRIVNRDKTGEAKKLQEYTQVEIQDTGIGISEGYKERLFERFYQNDKKHGKGYGIGLSHCKDLIEAHSGIIEIDSEKDVGTTIRFLLPIAVHPNLNEVTEEVEYEFYSEQTSKQINAKPDIQLISEKEPNRNKVLVVDDNNDMRSYIKSVLEKEFLVFEAVDGSDGLNKTNELLPDLIISDIMMPNVDGIEFCKILKTDVKTSHIPVILLTARVDSETKYQGLEIGADDYVSKPFDIDFLVLRIKNLLKSRAQLRELFQNSSKLEPALVTVTSLDEKFLTKLMHVIEKGIPDERFTVANLENEMGMSHANFYRKLKSITGMSGKEILLDMRLKRAAQLLKDNPKMRISDVGYMVGFINPKYFSKCFKQKYGTIPSDFEEYN